MDPMDQDSPPLPKSGAVSPSLPPLPSVAGASPSPGAGSVPILRPLPVLGQNTEKKRPASISVSSPAPDPSAPTSQDQPTATTPNPSKRKRGPGDITQNACTECRKKRAKCDGQMPCSRCKSQKDVECVYTKKVVLSKDELRNQVEQLQQVLAAVVRPDIEPEVLQRLRAGQTVDAIANWLRDLDTLGRGTATPTPTTTPVGFPPGPSAGHPALARFPSGSATGYGHIPTERGTASPVSSQGQPGLRYESNQPSPWGGHFSPITQGTPRESQTPTARWDPEPAIRGPPLPRIETWAEAQRDPVEHQRLRGIDQILAPETHYVRVPPPGTWTNITADSGLVNHLLTLYFCWEYPTFASLSKEHFLKDFMDGRQRFCSPMLVNALLALGCRFSSKPSTRANSDDPYTSGDHFFRETLRLYYEENNHHSLTTIQALGIMSIREASCGRDSESWYYAGQSIKLAIEMGLHQIQHLGRTDDESAVQAATFWGAFALDHAWSLATGSLPQCSCFPQLPPKPAIINDIEASLWIPYTDDGAPLQRSCEQPSNVRSVYKCFCELSELVHRSLYILHSPGRPLTSKDLLGIYNQYISWYDSVPEVLRLGHNFTPAVLFAHMYYHFAILLLFRPLIRLKIVGSTVTPRDVCLDSADAMSGLLRNYSQLYTLRRTPSFVPYFVLTSSIMHLAIGAGGSDPLQPQEPGAEGARPPDSGQTGSPKVNPRVAEALGRGIADLTEMAPCHFFAEQALNILRFLAKKWHIDVDIKPASPDEQQFGFFRDPQVRPATNSLNFFSPNVTDGDFNCSWGAGQGSRPAAGLGAEMRADTWNGDTVTMKVANALENPLFWPFPMQGRPMLPTGDALKEAGFELL